MARDKSREREDRRRVGRRIRRRRLLLGMTQAALAHSLGVSFQQVQKYEKGLGAVPERRLAAVTKALDVTADYFREGGGEQADAIEHFLQSPQGIALCRAITLIPDEAVRARLVLAVGAFSDAESHPEDGETRALLAWLTRIAGAGDGAPYRKAAATAIRALKVELACRIGHILKARKLTQKFAAQILRTDQARISALMRGNVEATSLEKLLRYLVLLGWNAELAITRRPLQAQGRIGISGKQM